MPVFLICVCNLQQQLGSLARYEKASLGHLTVTGKVEESKRESKTEVSRQLVCMLGGQSELDTDHQGCRGQIALISKMVANVVHDGMASLHNNDGMAP